MGNKILNVVISTIIYMFIYLNCNSIKRHNIWRNIHHFRSRQVDWLVGWLVVLRINVDLAIFQPYLDLEAGDNQSLKIQVARPGIEPGPFAPQAKSLTTRPKKGDKGMLGGGRKGKEGEWEKGEKEEKKRKKIVIFLVFGHRPPLLLKSRQAIVLHTYNSREVMETFHLYNTNQSK